ncbi:MAG: hypothetical protein ACRC6R_10115 [Bacteroidales bacterium]
MGRIRLSYDDFERLTPFEFTAIADSWYGDEDAKEKQRWVRSRWMAAGIITAVRGKATAPKDLAEFEWEKTQAKAAVALSTLESFEKAKSLFK